MNIAEQINELIERQRELNKLNKLPTNTLYYVRGRGLVYCKELLPTDSVAVCDADKARALYLDEFVHRACIGLLPDELQPLLFHIATHDGLSDSCSLLQKVLSNLLSEIIKPAIAVTGFLDAATIRAARIGVLKLGARYILSFIVNAYIDHCRAAYKNDRITIEKKTLLIRRFIR